MSLQMFNQSGFFMTQLTCQIRSMLQFETNVRWTHVSFMLVIHLISLNAIYSILFGQVKMWTTLLAVFLHQLCALGLTAGVHRLWSHRAYKAKLPLRIFLMLCQTLTFQKSIITWSRDHRIHHRHSETERDPHNIHRGLFFAHVGWILLQKRPEVFEAGRNVDLSDLYSDSVVRFQARIYLPLMVVLCFVLPTWIPVHFWQESAWNAFAVAAILRHVLVLHSSFLINSWAHYTGSKRYDQSIGSTDNHPVALLAYGEGFHNYHHSFPQDYSTSELKYAFNLTTMFIDIMAWIGQAYDLKRTSAKVVLARRMRTGDLKGSALARRMSVVPELEEPNYELDPCSLAAEKKTQYEEKKAEIEQNLSIKRQAISNQNSS